MTYTTDILRKINLCGSLGYPTSKIINSLVIENTEQFLIDFYDPKNEVYQEYQKGEDKADFVLDLKSFEKAPKGAAFGKGVGDKFSPTFLQIDLN